MIFELQQQVILFCFTVASGVLLGIFFDCYRIIRGFENPNKIITAIEDMLFWILAGILIFIFIMYTNYAYISFNIFVYGVIGLILYLKLISSFFLKIVYNVINGIIKCSRVILYRITYPIRIVFYRLTEKNRKIIK